ncbi:MAG: 4Fe-4S binding protein [Deltaproteobacteria bacterium]|nr:4Fe-4S binding protein [Deltaproteobacteria bacterium]
MSQKIIGPDLRVLHSFQDLPIGATITGIGAATVPTGTWRFYRPQLREAVPPCQSACPAGVDVSGFISLVRKKRYTEAYQCYVMENPFPGLCGRLCDHPCESECFRKRYDEALAIQDLELFLSSRGYSPTRIPITESASKNIAVVGSRLEELSSVYFLTRLGHTVSLFAGKKGLHAIFENLVTTHGLPKEGPWKTEIEGIVETDSSISVETDPPPENLDQFDMVIWGLKEKPLSPPHDSFLLLKHESTVARAIGKGKETAIAVDLTLKDQDTETGCLSAALGPQGFPSFSRYLTLIAEGKSTEPEPVLFEDLNLNSFDRQPRTGGKGISDAVKEARRCFECGKCTLCGQCVAYCPDQAVGPEKGQKRVIFDYDYCKGCGICGYECPRGAIGFIKEEAAWQ